MDKPTSEGIKRIERWQSAVKRVGDLQRQLNSARCELTNAVNHLGRWMVPDDVEVGETIGVWHGDALISVKKTDASGNGSFEIVLRKSGH